MGNEDKITLDRLSKQGYSKTVAHAIWLWYYPTKQENGKTKPKIRRSHAS